MSEIAERVERHMAETVLPSMKVLKAAEAEGLQGNEDINNPKPNPAFDFSKGLLALKYGSPIFDIISFG